MTRREAESLQLRREAWAIIAPALPTGEQFEAHSDASEFTLARVVDLLGAVQLASRWIGNGDPIDMFETIADWFHRETGLMRPGKDVPAAYGGHDDHEERAKAFRTWAATMGDHVAETLQSTLRKCVPTPDEVES